MRELIGLLLLLNFAWIRISAEVQCMSCSGGKNCAGGQSCEGDYCILSRYAPRWGPKSLATPTYVKGCMEGDLLKDEIESECIVSEDDEEELECVCNGIDKCNSGTKLKRLEKNHAGLVTCHCDGAHCDDEESCLGEMCSYVTYGSSKKSPVEKGCVNASMPVFERATINSCMVPPLTGAMYHRSINSDVLLRTESCMCASDNCNGAKLKIGKEDMTCPLYIKVKDKKVEGPGGKCGGEYCFKAEIKSKIGRLPYYEVAGCASFGSDDKGRDELMFNKDGCGVFKSDDLTISLCYKKTQKTRNGKNNKKTPAVKEKVSLRKPPLNEDEIPNEKGDEEQDQENEMKGEGAEEQDDKSPESPEDDQNDVEDKAAEESAPTTTGDFIFKEPKQAPIPDESNAMMITVFVLIILMILVVGAVWKFELHRKLFRANYDTVAGG